MYGREYGCEVGDWRGDTYEPLQTPFFNFFYIFIFFTRKVEKGGKKGITGITPPTPLQRVIPHLSRF